MNPPVSARKSPNIKWQIFFPALGLLALWLLWPWISLHLYHLNNLDRHSAPALGQFGDLFGGLTSLFTLGALVFSIYVNYLQYQQFSELRRQEKLNNHRFINGILMDDTIMDASYMVQYDKFGYDGHPGYKGTKKTQSFKDTRLDRIAWSTTSDETERKIDKLLICNEQILLMLENNMLDDDLATPYLSKIDIYINKEDIRKYLLGLVDFYGSFEKSPYPRLSRRAKEFELILDAQKQQLRNDHKDQS